MKRQLVPPAGRDPLKARNTEQQQLLDSLYKNDQTFVLGRAGTGKTYLPSAYGAGLLLGEIVESFIVTRPAVGVGGERHGFLPGNLERKVAPWVFPIQEVLEERLGKENVKNLIQDGSFRVEEFEHMRGRTFRKAFVLVDEAQNATVEQMKCVLTRVGEGSKLVVTGDLGQSDLNQESGLSFALNLARRRKLPVEIVTLTKVERGGICGIWADAFEAEENQPTHLRRVA